VLPYQTGRVIEGVYFSVTAIEYKQVIPDRSHFQISSSLWHAAFHAGKSLSIRKKRHISTGSLYYRANLLNVRTGVSRAHETPCR